MSELKKEVAKPKKPEIEDRIEILLDGEMKNIALAFVAYLREKKMPPKSATKTSWKVSYKGKTVCSISINDKEWCVWTYVWYTNYITPEYQAEYENFVLNENLQEFIWDGLYACVAYHPLKGGGCCHPEKSCAGGQTKVVFGKEFKNMCIARDTFFYDPDDTAIEKIKKIIEFRQKIIVRIKK